MHKINKLLSITISLSLLLAISSAAHAVSFVTQPYLQSATDSGIWVLWMTDSDNESIVEYGTSEASLSSSSSGSSTLWQSNTLHEVGLTGLSADTVYYYRVKTNDAVSFAVC